VGFRQIRARLARALRRHGGVAARRFVFDDFYRRNKWEGQTSLSGTGSDPAQTALIEAELAVLLREIGVRQLLDVPCGDFAWMQRIDLGGIDYVGGDIVAPLIEANRRRYRRPGVEFHVIDLVGGPLPAADLLLCRDCLVHLPLADAVRALRAVADADIDHVLLTTFAGRAANTDVPVGKWRPLNLEKPPFNLPPPQRLIVEGCTEKNGRFADKALGLWRRDDLAVALGVASRQGAQHDGA
jgi:SAM-dependent methyltransferase